MKGKILFVDNAHEILIDELTASGYQCDYFPGYKRVDYEKIIHAYIGVIIRSGIELDQPMIDKAVNLKFIGRVGAGMESIDVDYAKRKGIVCLNSPEGNRDALAEHAMGMILCLFNNIKRADTEVRKGIWEREKNRGLEIKGKTVGIIGYGNMGGAFAQRLKGFGANVIAYDKYKKDFSDEYVKEVTLETIYEETNILSFHVPLTEETKYMFNDAFIGKFKHEIYLINTARGKVVNTDSLVKTLGSGKVKGACLDVLEYEKFSFEEIDSNLLPDSYQYLINSDNVILTPHIAGWTVESKYKLAKVLLDKIKEVL